MWHKMIENRQQLCENPFKNEYNKIKIKILKMNQYKIKTKIKEVNQINREMSIPGIKGHSGTFINIRKNL